jgi:hypothetical protein
MYQHSDSETGCGNDRHPDGTRREKGSVARSRVSAIGRGPAKPGAAKTGGNERGTRWWAHRLRLGEVLYERDERVTVMNGLGGEKALPARRQGGQGASFN